MEVRDRTLHGRGWLVGPPTNATWYCEAHKPGDVGVPLRHIDTDEQPLRAQCDWCIFAIEPGPPSLTFELYGRTQHVTVHLPAPSHPSGVRVQVRGEQVMLPTALMGVLEYALEYMPAFQAWADNHYGTEWTEPMIHLLSARLRDAAIHAGQEET